MQNNLMMKAAIFRSKNETLEIKEIPVPSPMEGEVLVRLGFAALNHRDIWIWKEQVSQAPVIPGSDGSGVVWAVGKGVDQGIMGMEVIINPSLYWGDNEKVQADNYQILGNPTNGTFAEFISIPQEYVYQKPGHLTIKEAAAIPLAALTAYRALFSRAALSSTDKVLITGIGGGAALYLLQMATAAGATVFVTSSSNEKISQAVELGARSGFNYREDDWVKNAKHEAGGFDVIVDSAGGNGFPLLTEVANPGARIVMFGRTAGEINNLKPGVLYNKQLQILGTLMGTQDEFRAMLEFYQKHQLHPVLDKEFSLNQVADAFQYMDKGRHFGKVMLRIE